MRHQQDLANRIEELGGALDRSMIARIEGGTKRRILIDDALMVAAALGVNPLHLITPREANSTVQLAPELERESIEVRSWFVGVRALFEDDARYYEEEVSDDELEIRRNPRVGLFLDAMRPLIDALVEGDFESADELWGQVKTAAVLTNPKAKLSATATVTPGVPDEEK